MPYLRAKLQVTHDLGKKSAMTVLSMVLIGMTIPFNFHVKFDRDAKTVRNNPTENPGSSWDWNPSTRWSTIQALRK